MGKLQVVVGGQYGSEGKGAVTAWLAAWDRDVLAVRVAGPNAGHTAYDANGKEWKLRCVPVAAVTNPAAKLALGPGSEVDMEVLADEIEALEAAGHDITSRFDVDQSATLIHRHHREQEAGLVGRIGSTGKGIGAARSARLMRNADLYGGNADVALQIRNHLTGGGTVQIEGTQGYGLGLHGEFYPFCTSSDCRAIDFMAMAGISPWDPAVDELEVWVVIRTYPIRVAGDSGPMKLEIGWEELARRTDDHIQPETTTVTGKTRRVGEWDRDLAVAAIAANGGSSINTKVALTFLDYIRPAAALMTSQELRSDLDIHADVAWYERELGKTISLVGTGPTQLTRWSNR